MDACLIRSTFTEICIHCRDRIKVMIYGSRRGKCIDLKLGDKSIFSDLPKKSSDLPTKAINNLTPTLKSCEPPPGV